MSVDAVIGYTMLLLLLWFFCQLMNYMQYENELIEVRTGNTKGLIGYSDKGIMQKY